MEHKVVVTDEMVAMMEKLGISQADITRLQNNKVKSCKKVSKFRTPAKEYILKSVRHCKLCGTENISTLYMKQSEENPNILVSSHDEIPEGLPVEERFMTWATCNHCRDYLCNLTVETLADMIMAQHGKREVWK